MWVSALSFSSGQGRGGGKMSALHQGWSKGSETVLKTEFYENGL